ncbi:MAG: hypothetical protein V4635_11450 [Bacteroidota bacterium]
MKTTSKPAGLEKKQSSAPSGKNYKTTKGATNPKKPNNDPDQTPDREVENLPRAKPGKSAGYSKNNIGFKK